MRRTAGLALLLFATVFAHPQTDNEPKPDPQFAQAEAALEQVAAPPGQVGEAATAADTSMRAVAAASSRSLE